MGLPSIAAYEGPAPDEYPENRVAWQADPARAVLLVHDMQQYFVDAFDPASPALRDAVENIARLADAARALGVPVVLTAQPQDQQPADRGLLTDFWGPGIPAGGSDAVIDELAPQPEDTVVTKWRYDAFVRTGLRDVLRDRGRDQLVVTGIYAHIGCLVTACDAFMHDVQPFLVGDAVADFSLAHHRQALEWAAGRCASVVTTNDVLTHLGARVPAVAGA
jgi:bifunctional isochorismate lyase / aryl carrier protein